MLGEMWRSYSHWQARPRNHALSSLCSWSWPCAMHTVASKMSQARLNNVVGHLLRSSLLVPYHGWNFSLRLGELKRYAIHFDKNGRPSGTAEVVYPRRSDAFQALKKYNNGF